MLLLGLILRENRKKKQQVKAQHKNDDLDDEEDYFILTREKVEAQLERIKHFLWHGNTFRALENIGFLELAMVR